MLTNFDRRRIVHERLELISVEYRERMDALTSAESSRGLISSYNATGGGRSGKTADLTAMNAMMDVSETFATKNARAWRGLCSRFYQTLLRKAGKTAYQVKHDEMLAWLVFHKVLMGMKLSEISRKEVYGSGHVPQATLSRYYSEIVDLLVPLAVRDGLIP